MAVNSISNVNSTTQTGAEVAAASSAKLLSQSDFLKLLVAQMTSQDPLNPTDSQNLLTQTVQLSTLQSTTSLQKTLTELQNSQGLAQAGALLGRQVTLQDDTNSALVQGVVSSVDVSSGTPMIVVNGASYSLSQLLTVSTPSTNP
jgi:flagellar basal-body rod modification protein FlgD